MTDAVSGAHAILTGLKANGIGTVFANSGTDFTAIIEALASPDAAETMPRMVIAPHENAAVAMAHGHYLVTGEPQAVMLHVNVGLANAVMGLINAHADDIPIIVLSGRTPLTEHHRKGARATPIQYGQEQFDQTAMVRELVKWSYELRYAENAAALVSRACAIARSSPPGAVYLSLPAEPLAEMAPPATEPALQAPASAPAPERHAVARAAEWIASAEAPLILLQRGDAAGRLAATVSDLASRHGIAVAEVFPTRNVLPSDHPMLVGPDTATHFKEADLVLVVDTGVAWIEKLGRPKDDAKVVHIGPDPLFTRLPVRSYRTDLAIVSEPAAAMAALAEALVDHSCPPGRAAAIEAWHRTFRDAVAERSAHPDPGRPITKAYLARCISSILGDDGMVFNERGALAHLFDVTAPNRFFGNTAAGGLGWCVPAALGALLANPDRMVVAAVGDGGYLFANPAVCHQIAEANDLPLLTVISNNHGWDAVRAAVTRAYPEGHAARANVMPLTNLEPLPDFCALAQASRAWARRIEEPADLAPALAEARNVVVNERRQALVDVVVAPGE